MDFKVLDNELELQQILASCYNNNSDQFCFSGIKGFHKKNFGTTFHQTKLTKLADLGFLIKCDSTRGGNRRYYKFVDRDKISSFLQSKGLV